MLATHAFADFRVAAEICHRALNLRPPDKAQRAFRTWQGSAGDKPGQHSSRFQDGYAAASIVIRPRALVIQMAAVDDLPAFGIGPRNGATNHGPVSRANFGLHFGGQNNGFTSGQPRAQ